MCRTLGVAPAPASRCDLSGSCQQLPVHDADRCRALPSAAATVARREVRRAVRRPAGAPRQGGHRLRDVRRPGVRGRRSGRCWPSTGPTTRWSVRRAAARDPREASREWLVDPLCGTRNFAAQTPLVAVNVALRTAGATVAAASADPLSDEVFWTDGSAAFVRRAGADTPLRAGAHLAAGRRGPRPSRRRRGPPSPRPSDLPPRVQSPRQLHDARDDLARGRTPGGVPPRGRPARQRALRRSRRHRPGRRLRRHRRPRPAAPRPAPAACSPPPTKPPTPASWSYRIPPRRGSQACSLRVQSYLTAGRTSTTR